MKLDPTTTVLLVLDLTARCESPDEPCARVIPPTRALLDRAREAGLTILYSVSASHRGTPAGAIAAGLAARDDETIFYPDAFDKFTDPDLLAAVRDGGTTVLLCGASTNIAVLYTATSAARMHGFEVVIATDCVAARSDYENEYALYQLDHLPKGVTAPIHQLPSADLEF